MIATIQRLTIGLHQRLIFFGSEQTLSNQTLGVEVASSLLYLDLAIHHRLGCRRLIGFVMTPAAIADQIDHHILAKSFAVIHSQLTGEYNRLRIITIDVQDWCANQLGNIGTVFSGTGIFPLACGKANLIVHHNMNSTTGTISPGLRELEGLHHYALTGK